MKEELTFRFATRKDVSLILHFIKELAEYEKMLDKVVATQELIENWIFDEKKAAIKKAKEVHVFIDGEDHTTSVELGMALMADKPIKHVHSSIKPVDRLVKELKENVK